MESSEIKHEWWHYPVAGMLAATILGVVDARHCGASSSGVTILALRMGLIGLVFGGLQATWTAVRRRWGRRSAGIAAVVFPCLPWAFVLGDHLAQTATLRSLLPYWMVVGGSMIFITAALWLTMGIHIRYVTPKRGIKVAIGALHVIPFLFTSDRFADLHAPISLTAATAAWLSAELATYQVSKLLSFKTARFVLAGSIFLTALGFALPVDLEDSFSAADKGVVVRYLAKTGAHEKLPTPSPVSPSATTQKSAQSDKNIEAFSLPNVLGKSVVMISIDALRADHLSFSGYPRATTPNIDRLAEASVFFKRAYSASPSSSLSIPSLQAGIHMEPVLRAKAPLPATLADRLRGEGYATMGLFPSKVFSAGPELMGAIEKTGFGFEKWKILERDARKDAETAMQFVRDDSRRPIYLWVHFYDPHLPYNCHEQPFGNEPMDCYDAEIEYADKEIGKLLSHLEKELHDPIICLTADHGEAFGEHGRLYHSTDLHEEQIRVPLMIKVPGLDPRTVDSPVSNVDLADTITWLVGEHSNESKKPGLLMALAPGFGGFLPVTASLKDKRAIIKENHKLVCTGWPDGPCALYDLQKDPKEERNIAGRKPLIASTLLGELAHIDDGKLARIEKSAPLPIVLGRLGRRDAVDDLFNLAKNDTSSSAPEASKLLAMFRDDSNEEKLHELQKSGNKSVAAWAAVGSALIDEECNTALLTGFLDQKTDLGRWAAVALGLSKNIKALKPLLSNLKLDDPLIRAQSALALGKLESKKAVPALIELLDVKQSRWAAIEALGMIGDNRALESLTRLKSNAPDKSNLPRLDRALANIE